MNTTQKQNNAAREAGHMIEITARAKAFSNEGVKLHKFGVGADGTIRVWDPVAGYYTTCHRLSATTQDRIARIARNS